MSKYKFIAGEIEQKIITGQYLPGEQLPDQVKLAKEYETTRVTIQKSVKVLIQKGLIFSKQGSGMFVKKNILNSNYAVVGDSIRGTTNRLRNAQYIATNLIAFDVRFPKKQEADFLMIQENIPIYDTIRLRFIDEKPFKLEHSMFPVELIANLTSDILEHSIYEYMKNQLELNPSGVSRVVRADKATEQDIEYLQVNKNDPILEVEQVVYLDNGTPFEYSFSRSPYDKAEFVINRTILEE